MPELGAQFAPASPEITDTTDLPLPIAHYRAAYARKKYDREWEQRRFGYKAPEPFRRGNAR